MPLEPERIREQSVRLRRLAAAIVGESLADDVLQDVWVAALDGPRTGERRSPAWLNKVTRNLAWRRRIGDSRRRHREQHASGAEASEGLEEIVTRIEEGHLIERALVDLEEPYRSVLLWRYYEELSIAEISRCSGRPESTTRTHLQRGLERLRERLKNEHGPDWRAALLPLLRIDGLVREGSVPASGLATAGLGGLLMTTLLKPALIAAALLSAFLGYRQFVPAEVLQTGPGEQNHTPLAIVMDAAASPAEESPVLPTTGVRAALAAATLHSVESAAVASPTTLATVVDPASGLGIPNLSLRVRNGKEVFELETDGRGEVSLPFALASAERRKSGPAFSFEAVVDGSPEHRISLTVRTLEDSDAIQLRLDEASTLWVRMPIELAPEGVAGISATLGLKLERGITTRQPTRYSPVTVRGSDLLFVIPNPQRFESSPPKVLSRVIEIDVGGASSFGADLPPRTSLADPPYPAHALARVAQEVLVRSALTGLPVPGAFVSLRETGHGQFSSVELASGTTDANGMLQFKSAPPGRVQAILNAPGFELTISEVEVLGGSSLLELQLNEQAEKSDLAVTVRLERGPVPAQLFVTLLGSHHRMLGSQALEPQRTESGGWRARTTFSELPPGRSFLSVTTELPGLGTQEKVPVELPGGPVVIDLATPPESRALRLQLPGEIRNADFWVDNARERVGRSMHGAFDGATIARVPVARIPCNWILSCEGHVPLLGREDAWTEHTTRRKQTEFVLAPRFERGTGFVLRLVSGDLPITNAHISDSDTGALLGTTDDRGFALLRDIEEGDTVQLSASGFEPREVELVRWPFLRTWMQKR